MLPQPTTVQLKSLPDRPMIEEINKFSLAPVSSCYVNIAAVSGHRDRQTESQRYHACLDT